MKKFNLCFSFILSLFLLLSATSVYSQLTRPADFFGFRPGADRMLFDYEQLVSYLEKIDAQSPRLEMRKIGTSPMGKPMYAAFFSSPENIERLDTLKEINRELALNPGLTENHREAMIREGKVFFIATLSMHSSEVGPSQAAPLIAYKLASTQNPDTLRWLEDVVYMMIPSHNPDGMDMIVRHYKKYKDTKYEGSSMPGVYHKYVGHDNNRDFVTLTQEDNRAISRIFSKTWFPQVMVEKHQMGSTGPRYFVPPNHDPVAENIDASLWNWIGLFGMNMAKDMTREELAGVSQHYAFDNYWPGSTETCIWKNVIGFLTESASAKYATPVYVEPNELSVWGKGLAEYDKSINMPLPWEGGWWKLSDILNYEVVSTMSIIKTCYQHKKDILRFRNEMSRKETEKGRTRAPYYYIFPVEQHDPGELVDLVNLLGQHGVERYRLKQDVEVQSTLFHKGDIVIPLAQPFRPFIKEVLETQEYPERHYTPGGKLIEPYDITSWSLPLHKGLDHYEINEPSGQLDKAMEKLEGLYTRPVTKPVNYKALYLPFEYNDSYQIMFWAINEGLNVYTASLGENTQSPEGFVVEKPRKEEKIRKLESMVKLEISYLEDLSDVHLNKLSLPKIALVESYRHDMDAGWTRYVFDTYHIAYDILRPGDINAEKLEAYDVVVFPNTHSSVLIHGQYKSESYYRMSSYPPEYTKGMGEEGKQDLMKYLDEGGKILSWGQSAELFMGEQKFTRNDQSESFQLPVSNVAGSMKNEGLYIPGTLMNIELDSEMVFTRGMQDEIGVFHRDNQVFSTSVPVFDMDRRVVGRFTEKDPFLSGYAEEARLLEGEPAMVWVKKGKGELILFSFNPQFRAAVPANFKLIFNSILFRRN